MNFKFCLCRENQLIFNLNLHRLHGETLAILSQKCEEVSYRDSSSLKLLKIPKNYFLLFEYFSENTKPNDSFTGSMQLLAGVKLCTDRPITNHPHYENKFLRQRTKEVIICGLSILYFN